MCFFRSAIFSYICLHPVLFKIDMTYSDFFIHYGHIGLYSNKFELKILIFKDFRYILPCGTLKIFEYIIFSNFQKFLPLPLATDINDSPHSPVPIFPFQI